MKRHVLDCGRAFRLMQDPEFKAELKTLVAWFTPALHQLLVKMQAARQDSDFKAICTQL